MFPAFAVALAALVAAAPADLLTTAEKSSFERTGRHDEVVRLCRAYERAFPRRARCFTFGTTPEGRELVALAASADGVVRPLAARTKSRPVVLVQGAIHAGELDGKDAGFMLLRELLASADGGPLARVTALFIPVLNVDGHERFGPNQRPNQRGPAELGWRTTARNDNLNRDYTKADAPETRALLALLAEWDPIVYADLHVTDGAQFEHDLAVLVEPRLGYDPALRAEGQALSDALLARLEAKGHLPLDFYPAFDVDGDPASGFSRGVPPARFANGYWAARNRFGVLFEAHSWRPYAERVTSAIDFSRALLELAAEHGVRWVEAASRADRAAPGLAGKEVALAFGVGGRAAKGGTTPDAASTERPARTLRFRGYAYRRETSVVTGRPVVAYDESRPEIWEIPLREDVHPTVTAILPRGGWIVPAAWAATLGPKLRQHGVLSSPLTAPQRALPVEVFRATKATFGATSYEGRQTLTVEGTWEPATRDVAAGALFVPAAQARALLAAHLLEPAGPDSFLSWGELNSAFERKEYIEDYVLEPFARELLAGDAVFRADFERRLRDDPAFAGDPQARIELFHRRHPSFDAAYRVYPILRTGDAPNRRADRQDVGRTRRPGGSTSRNLVAARLASQVH